MALDKNPGVRPIGIGEVLRRIVGKLVVANIEKEIQEVTAPIQTCGGMRSGSEAAIHAMKAVFEDTVCEAVLLIDAENAFNCLNRKVALHNIQIILSTFLSLSYQHIPEDSQTCFLK